MSTLILLSKLRVENANAVAGLTWGFPAITHFLGYTHALSRKLTASHGLKLERCAVICHDHQVHAHSSGREYQFALTRNPLTKEGKTAAFNEEGRMHLTVSLLLQCEGEIERGKYGMQDLAKHLAHLCPSLKLAGGSITNTALDVDVMPFPQSAGELYKIVWKLMPGFVLRDRSAWLRQHHQQLVSSNPDATMLDAWLDFAAFKQQAVVAEGEPEEAGAQASWAYLAKPQPGWLVPLMIGYQRISPLYAAGSVLNARDTTSQFAFTEAAYGVGEWCGLHRIQDLNDILWCYHPTENGYYCRSVSGAAEQPIKTDEKGQSHG